jgi:hypothetical protein
MAFSRPHRLFCCVAIAAAVTASALTRSYVVAASPDRVITDVAVWKHPTKDVLVGAHFHLERVEMHKGAVYPVFFVSGPAVAVSPALGKALSAANGWWSSEIRHVTAEGLARLADPSAEGDIDVDQIIVLSTKRAKKTVTVHRLVSADQAVDRVAKAVKFDAYKPVVLGGEKITFSMIVDGAPILPFASSGSSGSWSVSVGENHPDHRVTLHRYEVDAVTGAVWEVDPVEGRRKLVLKAS